MSNFVYLTPSPAEVTQFQTVFKREEGDKVTARLFVAGRVVAKQVMSVGHFFELFPETSRQFTLKCDSIYLTQIADLFGESVANQLFNNMEVV